VNSVSSVLKLPAETYRRILGVEFFIGGIDAAVDRALSHGGLVVAPSAPGLAVDLIKSPFYREALTSADLAITDSAFMVVLWRLFTGEKLPRHSGLKFIRAVLARPQLKRPGAVFWVMPSVAEDTRNRAWLVAQGFSVTADDVYIAPHYPPGPIADEELVRRIEGRNPQVVMLAIGGGVQERVGLMLRSENRKLRAKSCELGAESAQDGGRGGKPEAGNLKPEIQSTEDGGRMTDDRRAEGGNLKPEGSTSENSGLKSQVSGFDPAQGGPAILCLGAAIAFLSGAGGQSKIPMWADRLMLGLFIRFLGNPRRFWRRYWDSLPLIGLIWRYRDRLPELEG
jgi:UDP-N-acetyl-D-mannosaminuronic acid transferase (WecB/TagA/CpsF family)